MKEKDLEESGRGSKRWQKQVEAVEGSLFTLRMMCLEGNAPFTTCDQVTWPQAGFPASMYNT